jgi:ribose 5-phosphate isomerase B
VSFPSQEDIRSIAGDVFRQMAGDDPFASSFSEPGLARSLVSQEEIRAARKRGERVLVVSEGAIVTPLARDLAGDYGIEIRVRGPGAVPSVPPQGAGGPSPLDEGGPIAIGADHGGFPLKEALGGFLKSLGVRVKDVGTHSKASCDYPDLAAAVAKSVALGEASWGIMIDGAGIGSCMAANKIPGVLAATCHDVRTAKNSREHNGANVLCLGSVGLPEGAAMELVRAWLTTPFGGGRHGRRVDKIRALEGSFLRQ